MKQDVDEPETDTTTCASCDEAATSLATTSPAATSLCATTSLATAPGTFLDGGDDDGEDDDGEIMAHISTIMEMLNDEECEVVAQLVSTMTDPFEIAEAMMSILDPSAHGLSFGRQKIQRIWQCRVNP